MSLFTWHQLLHPVKSSAKSRIHDIYFDKSIFAIPIATACNACPSPLCLPAYLKDGNECPCPGPLPSPAHRRHHWFSTAFSPQKTDLPCYVYQQRLPGYHAGWSQFVIPRQILPGLPCPSQVPHPLISFSEYPRPWNSLHSLNSYCMQLLLNIICCLSSGSRASWKKYHPISFLVTTW